MHIEPHSKVLFIGDSITDCGPSGMLPEGSTGPRGPTRGVSEGLFDPLGRGYVTMVDALLTSTYPDRRIRVLNTGVSGHTIRDLAKRWEQDVLGVRPDWLSVMIGINDVWRQFDLPRMPEIHVGLEEYERTYGELLEKTRSGLKGLVLMTPYYIEPHEGDAMRRRMSEYGAAVRRLADRYDATFVDTQAAYDAMLKHMHPNALAWDRVHPNQPGHMVLARAWLRAVGYAW